MSLKSMLISWLFPKKARNAVIHTYFHLSCSSPLSGLRSHLKPPSQDSGNFKVVALQNDSEGLCYTFCEKTKIQTNNFKNLVGFTKQFTNGHHLI